MRSLNVYLSCHDRADDKGSKSNERGNRGNWCGRIGQSDYRSYLGRVEL